MKDLVSKMTAPIPSDRPVMQDVVAQFDDIRSSLPWWALRRPMDKRWIPMPIRLVRMTPTRARTALDMWHGTPAVPVPRPT